MAPHGSFGSFGTAPHGTDLHRTAPISNARHRTAPIGNAPHRTAPTGAVRLTPAPVRGWMTGHWIAMPSLGFVFYDGAQIRIGA